MARRIRHPVILAAAGFALTVVGFLAHGAVTLPVQ